MADQSADSLAYIPIAEALILSFLLPLFTAYACSLFLHQPFDRRQLYAGLICFFGVIVIARPDQIWFGTTESYEDKGLPAVTPMQHVIAVVAVLISDLGGTVAFTSIRVVGTRVHPLISVNYYALLSTILSGALLLIPALPVSFRLPRNIREWGLMLGIGVFGFGLQFLMTAGLVKDKSPRATNMMYSSVVFGVVMDWTIWGVVPGWSSWVGGAVVVGATVWVAMSKVEVVEKESYELVHGDDERD
jgi:drug/metabolite transporter (DMT)-like permease